MTILHPLFGARLRHERALEHLAHIQREVGAIYDRASNAISHDDPESEHHIVKVPKPAQPRLELSVRVGEMIYNLRAALDYLVYALARHDSGQTQENTQFPIEHGEKLFWEKRPRVLVGVSDEHVALIEAYQPYKGCDWTALLAGISNPDKHRELQELSSTFDPKLGVSEIIRTDIALPNDEVSSAKVDLAGRHREVRVYLDVALDVTFRDGPPIVETLEALQAEVGWVLDRFTGEFRPPRLSS